MMQLNVFLLFLLTASARAREEVDPLWMQQLKTQLWKDESCTLLYAIGMQEFYILGRVVVSGRAHCDDGRSFDVERES